MDLLKFMQDYAAEIDGQFSEYNDTKSVIIVPLADSRFQSVVGEKKHAENSARTWIELSSHVCKVTDDLPLRELLEENTNFVHGKFSIVEEYLQLEASAFIDNVTDEILKEIIQEVANLADHWEFKLTGQDVH